MVSITGAGASPAVAAAKDQEQPAPAAEKKPPAEKPAEPPKEGEKKGLANTLKDLNIEQLFVLVQLVPLDQLRTMTEDELKQVLQTKLLEQQVFGGSPFAGNLGIGGGNVLSGIGLGGGGLVGNMDPTDFRVTGVQMAGFDPNMPAAASTHGLTTNPLFGGFMPDPFGMSAFGIGSPPAFSFF